jgi:hypothetical protein
MIMNLTTKVKYREFATTINFELMEDNVNEETLLITKRAKSTYTTALGMGSRIL